MSLGKEMRKLRIDKGLSQKELHEKTGFTQKYLSEIEHDKVDPRTAVLVRIAQALEVSTDYLLGLTNDPRPRPRAPQVERQDATAPQPTKRQRSRKAAPVA